MEVSGSVVSKSAGRSAKPVLGFRRQPGRLAGAVFRLPLPLYRRGWGGLLGHTFLLLVHAGRKTGKPHPTVAMVLRYDRRTREAVICSAWGQDTDWIRNIRVRPALQVQIGRESFTPEQRFLSEEESLAVVAGFRRAHPGRLRLLESILGWGDLRSDTDAREFVSTRPFVSFRPADPAGPGKATHPVNKDRPMRAGRLGHQ
jgi:deazaflavin-dependent oxidoreductase (nitroreductase family)